MDGALNGRPYHVLFVSSFFHFCYSFLDNLKISIASTKIYQYFYVFILFALVLSSNLQFGSLFVPAVA
jgi:hypothetical protein